MLRRAALPLAAALLLGVPLTAAPAWAAGSLVSPGAGAVYAEDTAVRVQADVAPRSAATQLRLVEPNGVARTVASAGPSLTGQTLAFTLDTSCPEYPGTACSGRRPAPNGTWTAQLTGGATDSRTFVLRIPPRAPSEVRAEATGPREVVVTWQRGAEPDLRGHDVVDGEGRLVADGDDDCAGGTCRTVVRYADDAPATTVVAVRAVRAACPGCEESVTATSSTSSVTRPVPAAPAPEPAPADGAPPSEGPASDPAPPGDGTAEGGDSSGGGTGAAPSATPAAGGAPGGVPGGAQDGSGPTAPEAGSAPGGGAAPRSGSGTPSPAGGTGSSGDVVLGAPAAQAAADEFALTFRAFGPKIGLPKLPPLPATGVALPDVAPPEDGGFAQALPFEDRVAEERVAQGPVARVGGAVSAAVGTAVDSERLARSLAAALVLLLGGAHVRLWLGRVPSEH